VALSFAHGDLAWNSADAATTTYTVSGLSFQPKALFFWINGMSSATDAISTATSARWCFGFASGTADRRCQGYLDVDNAATGDTQEIYRNDAILATVSAAGAVDGLLDLTAINSDGFVLTVDDAAPVNLRVFWAAWGGTDITSVATGEIAEPAATGNQDYVVTGSFQPVVVLLAGCQLTAAPPTAAVQDAGLMFGAATGAAAGNQFVLMTNSDEGSATIDVDQYMQDAECLAMCTVAGGNPNARASFVQFNATGFRLNWIARAVTNRRYIYLAIAGGSWRAGSYTLNLATVGNTTTVSGLAFQPVGGLQVDHGDVIEQTAGTSVVDNNMNIGCWSSTTSRRCTSIYTKDGTANTEIDLLIDYDTISSHPDGAGALYGSTDLDAINSDGFRVIVDDAYAAVTNFNGYLVFGDAPAAGGRIFKLAGEGGGLAGPMRGLAG